MEKNNGLDSKFNELLNVFSKDDTLISNGYPNYDLFALKTELKNKWNIFNFHTDTDIHRFLESLLKNNYPKKLELLNGQVGIFEFINDDYMEKNSILKGKSWDEFLIHIKHEIRFHSNYVNYDVLKYFLSLLTDTIHDVDYYRARNSNGEVLTKDEMSAPPKEKATAGRANAEGVSHLYLGNDTLTAISEIQPNKSDEVYVGRFPIRKELKVIDFRLVNNIDVFEMQEVTKFAINIDILNEMITAISKPISSIDTKLDYLPTQFIVDFIKSLGLQNEERYDGIIFDSTLGDGHNLMLFEPDTIECIDLEKRYIQSLLYTHS
ncbi:RES family NAD+ phosphorylase [Jeotgalicoccus sp. FSL K6-3177]|uniref:RES family NAD+ phosphorylase n=1 Tax=Jeotgalicoccus sp. FSL K6-3177 TaxID=2921494 RepID=UPI0030FD9550